MKEKIVIECSNCVRNVVATVDRYYETARCPLCHFRSAITSPEYYPSLDCLGLMYVRAAVR